MHPIRRQRLAALLETELRLLFEEKIRDPRVSDFTISKVEMSSNGKEALVFIIFQEATRTSKKVQKTFEGLNASIGFLKTQIAHQWNTRYVPQLVFREDRGLENTLKIETLLKEVFPSCH